MPYTVSLAGVTFSSPSEIREYARIARMRRGDYAGFNRSDSGCTHGRSGLDGDGQFVDNGEHHAVRNPECVSTGDEVILWDRGGGE